MSESDLYLTLLTCCQAAFKQWQYLVSYHALSASMYCCLEAKDAHRLDEVVQIAYDHIADIAEHFGESAFPDEPLELSFYRSLTQISCSRLLIFRK